MTTNYTVNYTTNYLVAAIADRIMAEEALISLRREEIPDRATVILGKGFKTLEEYKLPDPVETTWKRLRWTATWLAPFGFLGGMGFNVVTGLNTFPWAGDVGNILIGGLLGAIGGTMGSILASDGWLVILSGKRSMTHRQRIDQGQYLVVVKGSETLIRRATKALLKYETLSLENYPE
jgi:hypothetical protein